MEATENARVRWLDVVPTVHEGREVFVIRDPEGITDKSLVVSKEVLFLLSLMDGTRSVGDIQAEYTRASGALMYTNQIASVIKTMDDHFLLLNNRYESHVGRLKEECDSLPVRNAFLSGRSYPDNEVELRSFLGSMLQPGHGAPTGEDRIVGIMAPHIDYGRGMNVYAPIYRHLPTYENVLFVIFGTCHKATPKLWSISLKDMLTPLGRVRTSKSVGDLLKQDPVLRDYVDEWPHRNEHSVELQLPLIQFLMKEAPFEVLSILTGSLHEYIIDEGKRLDRGEVPELAERLKTLLKAHTGPCVFIAAADLAHIGAQFGDTQPLDRFVMEESKQKDEELLRTVTAADPAGFFATVRREGDRRRICGLAPIYFVLSMLGSCRGELSGYEQWTDGASSVSFAGAVFREVR